MRENQVSDWHGQFRISPVPDPVEGWRSTTVGEWHVNTHAELPHVPVTVNGREEGILLGWPIDNCLITHFETQGVAPEQAVYTLGGRWLYVGPTSIHVDAMASQPCVFDPARRIAASSPGLIDAPLDHDLSNAFDVVGRDGWYPFGLTPKVGVRRLLPNHALDLTTFSDERVHGTSVAPVSLRIAAHTVLRALRDSGEALAPHGLYVGLTAGNDTRMLLAGLRNVSNKVSFYTGVRSTSAGNDIDLTIASLLSRKFGLSHDTPIRPSAVASEELSEATRGWLDRTGWVRAGARALGYIRLGSHYAFAANAVGGEIGRAMYWGRQDESGRGISPAELVDKVRAPAVSKVQSAASKWLAPISDLDRQSVLDLLYLENRLGAWSSPAVLGGVGPPVSIYPFCRRDAVDAMLGLPPESKQKGLIAREVVKVGWPELLSVPINRMPGLAGYKSLVIDAAKNFRFKAGSVRRRLARSFRGSAG